MIVTRGKNNSTIITNKGILNESLIEKSIKVLNQQAIKREKIIIIQHKSISTELNRQIEILEQKTNSIFTIKISEDVKKSSYNYQNLDDFLANFSRYDFTRKAILILTDKEDYSELSSYFEEISHPTTLEIDFKALVSNLNYYKSILSRDSSIMVMVKAFSYGTGDTEIAALLESEKVGYLGVAYADEGVNLREAGIRLPIMLMNPDKESFHKVLRFNLEPVIYSRHLLEKFLSFCISNQVDKPITIHLKVETGMNRLGILENELQEVVQIIKENARYLHLESMLSHLAASSVKKHDEFTSLQINRFSMMYNSISTQFSHKINRHILNSTGIIRFPDAHFDRIRLGLGFYGIGKSDEENTNLIHSISLKTKISQVKIIQKGETVGYDRKGVVDFDSSIAVIPIGYADGISRRMGNGKVSVYIHGQPCPFIGNICMDMSMIDVSSLNNVQEGDEVVIFSSNYPIQTIAKKVGTTSYEILTSVSKRVRHIYKT
jgi:Alr-MurF fusion protein